MGPKKAYERKTEKKKRAPFSRDHRQPKQTRNTAARKLRALGEDDMRLVSDDLTLLTYSGKQFLLKLIILYHKTRAGRARLLASPTLSWLNTTWDRTTGTDGIRFISVRAPWAELLVYGIRTIEHRHAGNALGPGGAPRWWIIHQSTSEPHVDDEKIVRDTLGLPFHEGTLAGRQNGIIGLIRVCAVVPMDGAGKWVTDPRLSETQRRWAMPRSAYKFAWLIDAHVVVPTIQCAGSLASQTPSASAMANLRAVLRLIRRIE